jgi:threonine dehydrogenase-like Zn-dependent dehydrogenase
MESIALRLHGKNDLRLERIELPEIADDEIVADVVTNSICMSTYKVLVQGADHRRVPPTIESDPVIVGHELCGTILDVGKNVGGTFSPGMKYTIQPAVNHPSDPLAAPGYSYPFCGGHATRVVIPSTVIEMGCVIPFEGECYFKASLAEPVSCLIHAFKNQYHTAENEYEHVHGIVQRGTTLLLGGGGPMGIAAIEYLLNGDRRPGVLVVADINCQRLERARRIIPQQKARKLGVDLVYFDANSVSHTEELRTLSGGTGYDDIFVFAPDSALIEEAGALLADDGCCNFFAGPTEKGFSAGVNFYDIHYNKHHFVGTTGSTLEDIHDALAYIQREVIDPSVMITHVGGLNTAAETLLHLPDLPGGKKLIYTTKALPLTPLDSFDILGRHDPLFRELADITGRYGGLWSTEAERYLRTHGAEIDCTDY